MPEQSVHTDDAPLAASKHGHAAAAGDDAPGDSPIGRSVTINRPVAEVFAYFRDFANLPRFMENVERIDVQDDLHSHWVVKAPAGLTVEWDAIVTDEAPDSFIAWSSTDGADVANSGRVDFHDAGARGTVVHATLRYDPPGGTVGKFIAKLFQREPAIQARRDLRRLKQWLETGEIATAARTRRQFTEENA